MATYTAVLVVPNEIDQDYVIEQLERLGVVAFCGPGSLAQGIGDDGEPEMSDDVAAGVVVGIDGLRVRVSVAATDGGPVLSLAPENCRLEGDAPGEYCLRPE